MKINEYKEFIKKDSEEFTKEYLMLGLIGEAGELCSIYKRALRDNLPNGIFIPQIERKLGDFFWYFYQLGNQDELFDTDLILEWVSVEVDSFGELLIDFVSSVSEEIYCYKSTGNFTLSYRGELADIIINKLDTSIEAILQINVDSNSSTY